MPIELSSADTFTAAVSTNGGNFTIECAIPFANLLAAGYDTNNLLARFFCCADGAGYVVAQSRIQTGTSNPNERMAPLTFGTPYGDMGVSRRYRLKLYFAETEGATTGQRVFNVKVQGQTVLTNLDVYTEATGANRELVKQVENVMALDQLAVELVPVVGKPVISGMALLPGGDGGGEAPVASSETVTVLKDVQMPFVLKATDADGDLLNYRIVSKPAHGALWSLAPQPSVAYTPDVGWTGTDTISFVANDGWTDSVPAAVTLVVKEADSGLEAHWKFNETMASGFVAVDATGHGNDGMVGKNVVWGNGVMNGAIRLDGVSEGVKVGSKLNVFSNGMSMAGWFKWNGKAGINYLVGSGQLYAMAVTNQSLMVYGLPAWTAWGGGAQFPVTSNAWTHVAVTYDETNVKLYRNGSLVWTRAGTGDLVTTNSTLYLGGQWNPSLGVVFSDSIFSGMMDDMRIYSRVLSSNEVATLSLPGIALMSQSGPATPLGMRAGATNTFWVSVMGASGTAVGYNWSLDGAPVPGATNASYLFVPSTNLVGARTLRLVAVDQTGSSVSNEWAVTVTPANANQLPVIGNASPASPLGIYTRLSQNFSATATDADLDPMTYAWMLDGVVQSGKTSTAFGWAPPDAAVGAHTVSFIATDALGGGATNDWSVTVTMIPNTPPVISNASPASPCTVMCGNSQVFSVTAGDPELDSLSYVWRLDGSVQAGQVANAFTYAPVVASAGSHAIAVLVADGRGGYATNSWSVTASNKPSLRVSASGAGGAYTSVAAAITAAVNGDIITIEDPVLTEKGIVVNKSVTIAGYGASNTVLQADASRRMASNRIFTVNSGVSATIRDMTLRNGHATGTTLAGGGAVKNSGTVTIQDCVLTANDQDGTGVSYLYGGGAIFNPDGGSTTTRVYRCAFIDNTATSHGGAAFYNRPSLFHDCTFERNGAAGGGGALKDFYGRGSTVIQCTFSSNTAPHGAACTLNEGGTLIAGTVNSLIANSTFFGNRATNAASKGGALYIRAATNAFAVVSCLFAGNSAVNGADLYTDVAGKTSLSNCYTEGTVGGTWASVDACQTNKGAGTAKLDPVLSHNGGAIKTHALLAASPAIDAGQNPLSLAYDQRGSGYARVTGAAADIGAYEYGSAPTPPAPETATNGVPVAWLQNYGFASNWDAAAMSDLDGDGLLAWQEWIAGTDPSSRTSVFQVVNFAGSNGQWAVAFDSVTGHIYSIIQCGSLITNAGGWVPSGVDATGTGTRLTLPSPAYSSTSTFFRVKVQTLP